MNESEFAPATPLTFTVTETVVLRVPDGVTAMHVVVLPQLIPVAVVDPKVKMVAPAVVEKPLPVMVTVVPPLAGPLAGVSEPSDGTYV